MLVDLSGVLELTGCILDAEWLYTLDATYPIINHAPEHSIDHQQLADWIDLYIQLRLDPVHGMRLEYNPEWWVRICLDIMCRWVSHIPSVKGYWYTG